MPNKDNQVQVPDRGYCWIVLMSAFFISFILDGAMYSFGIILDEIKEEFKVTDSISNLLSSLNTGFLFFSGPIVAGLANSFGCRTVVIGGALVTSAMYMGTVFSESIYIMMCLFGVIGGISTGCTYIASLIIIAEWFDKKRGIATGITMAGSGVGSFVFPPLIAKIIDAFGWRIAMSVCACIILLCVICGALLKPLNAQVEKDQNDVGSLTKTSIFKRNAFLCKTIDILKEMSDFKLLVQNGEFFCLTISNFFIFTGYFTPFLYITKIAISNNISKAQASFLISIIGAVNIPVRIIFGFVADQKIITAVNLNTGSVFVSTVPLFFYIIMQYFYWSQILFSVVFAIGIAGVNCLTTMYLCEVVGLGKFSNATGIVELFRGFGCFLGPFLAGLISSRFGEVQCFFFSGICFAIGFLFSLQASFCMCCKKTKEKTNDEEQVSLNNDKLKDSLCCEKNIANDTLITVE